MSLDRLSARPLFRGTAVPFPKHLRRYLPLQQILPDLQQSSPADPVLQIFKRYIETTAQRLQTISFPVPQDFHPTIQIAYLPEKTHIGTQLHRPL